MAFCDDVADSNEQTPGIPAHDPDSPYWNPDHPEHGAVIEAMKRRLSENASPDEQASPTNGIGPGSRSAMAPSMSWCPRPRASPSTAMRHSSPTASSSSTTSPPTPRSSWSAPRGRTKLVATACRARRTWRSWGSRLVFAGIGALKSRWSPRPWWRASLETLAVGGCAATVAYALGAWLRGLVA